MNKKVLNLAWRNLRRNTRRSIATGSAIATGFAAFMIASAYAYRVEKVLSNYTIYGLHVGHIGIYKKDGIDLLSIKPQQYSLNSEDQKILVNALNGISSIDMIGRYLTGQGLVGNGCKTFPFVATGVDLDVEERVMNHPNLLKWNQHVTKYRLGKPIWSFPEEFGAVGLSEGLAKLLGKFKRHDELGDAKPFLIADCSASNVRESFSKDANVQLASGTWDGTLGAQDGEMVMTFSTGLTETNNTSVTTSLKYLQRLLNTESISNLSVWLKDSESLSNSVGLIHERLGPFAKNYEIFPWTDERLSPYYSGTMQFIYVMVGFIGCVLAVVVILSIFNSATMTVIERSQEIGMFRSVGYSRPLIRSIFVYEGLFLTLISAAIGSVIGTLFMLIVNSLGISIHPPGVASGIQLLFAPNFAISVCGVVGVSILGIGSTWIAVSSVVRKNISNLVSGAHR